MAADRGLRQLEDRAQLGYRELVAFEEHQDAAACRIAQDGQIVEYRGFHPYIRMDCYTDRSAMQAGSKAPDSVRGSRSEGAIGSCSWSSCLQLFPQHPSGQRFVEASTVQHHRSIHQDERDTLGQLMRV